MGVSNVHLKAMNTYPQTLKGLVSRRDRRVKGSRKSRWQSQPVTVGALLAHSQAMPEKSILLGHCADGLPFLMALEDPAIGAVLVSGGRGSGKTHQLQVMAEAAIRSNRPHELQLTVVSHNPFEWQAVQKDRRVEKYLQGVYAWYDPQLEAHFQHLTEMVEKRRSGGMNGPVNLVILDDLHFVETISPEAQVNLRWLLEYGAQSGVWFVGAVSGSQVQNLSFWVEVFRTRIFGWVPSRFQVAPLEPPSGLQANVLEPGTFRAWTGDSWITYQLPLLGDDL